MLKLEALHEIITDSSQATGIPVKDYTENGMFCSYVGDIDPYLVNDGLVLLKTGHFSLTSKGLNKLLNPHVPNWDGFNAYMLTDQTFKSYRDIVRTVDGDLTPALYNAYQLVDKQGVAAFSLVWGAWVAASEITATDRNTIASVAESFNLPVEFVTIIRGNL